MWVPGGSECRVPVRAFSPGRAAAHDGHGRLTEGERALLNYHVPPTHATRRVLCVRLRHGRAASPKLLHSTVKVKKFRRKLLLTSKQKKVQPP